MKMIKSRKKFIHDYLNEVDNEIRGSQCTEAGLVHFGFHYKCKWSV